MKARWGFGDRTGGGALCDTTSGSVRDFVGVVGRFCSNIFTKEVVGGMEVSSVGFSSSRDARIVLAAERAATLALLLGGCGVAAVPSSLASTLLTLPAGGSTSLSVVSLSLNTLLVAVRGIGFIGLWRAAASFAAMFDGEGVRSEK